MDILTNKSSLTLVFFNTAIHGTGICVLVYFYKRGKRNSQQIYFINLSISEVLLNFIEMVVRIPEMVSHDSHIKTGFKYMEYYASLFNMTSVWVVLYLTMMLITFDRFLMVRFGMRYKMYWTMRKAKWSLITTWMICLFTSLGISIGGLFHDFHYQDIFYEYVFPTIDFGYIILAASTYIYIFYRYQKSCKMKNKFSKRTLYRKRQSTATDVFRESRFSITIMLVSTFIVFVIIPDLIYLFLGTKGEHFSHNSKPTGKRESDILFDFCRVSYAVASTIDFFIYIFIQPAVKEILCRKLQHIKSIIYERKDRDFSQMLQNIAETNLGFPSPEENRSLGSPSPVGSLESHNSTQHSFLEASPHHLYLETPTHSLLETSNHSFLDTQGSIVVGSQESQCSTAPMLRI